MRGRASLDILARILGNLVLAFVASYVLIHTGVVSRKRAVMIGLLLLAGCPLVLLPHTISWEDLARRLKSFHTSHWLVKLIVLAVVLGVWR